MGRNNSAHQLSRKVEPKKKSFKPVVYVDKDADFASIKIAPGVESKSYLSDGILFSEDKSGKIIEVQVLNLSEFRKRR